VSRSRCLPEPRSIPKNVTSGVMSNSPDAHLPDALGEAPPMPLSISDNMIG